MKNSAIPEIFELAQRETLRAAYIATKQSRDFHHTIVTISRLIVSKPEYGSIRNTDVPALIKPYVESGLVHESLNAQTLNPVRPQQISRTYQIDLERESEILEIINSTSTQVSSDHA